MKKDKAIKKISKLLKTNEKKLIRWDYPLSKLPKISASYKENTENYYDNFN